MRTRTGKDGYGQNRCECPGYKAMRSIAEKTLVYIDVIPAGSEPASDVTTEGRGYHRHSYEKQSGRPAGGGGRDTFTAPGRNHGQARADAKGHDNQCDCCGGKGTC